MNPGPQVEEATYEPRDARVGWVTGSAVIVVFGIAACFAVAQRLDRPNAESGRPVGPELSFRHGVVDESGINRDWLAQDTAVRRHLEGYARVPGEVGTVQIPLARAMDLMVKEAAPTKAKP